MDVLSRSRFSLCPRGTGASTIRFWESLQAGAIPVLIGDDMILPKNFDWDACTITIAAEDISNIPFILNKISTEQEATMKKNCLIAYKLFAEKNFISIIKKTYNQS
jgi:hypothetical protein